MELYNKLSKEERIKLIKEAGEKRFTLSFYKYHLIKNLNIFRNFLFVELNKLDVLGRIFVASEGINAQLSLPSKNIEKLKNLIDDITFLTIASGGNSVDFGNLVAEYNIGHSAGTGDATRAVFCCGYVEPAPSATSNVIQYVTFATGGDAVDFGDAVYAERYRSAQSNAHGGLG